MAKQSNFFFRAGVAPNSMTNLPEGFTDKNMRDRVNSESLGGRSVFTR
jgi:hypothetical protein